jgi:hypothetical protein
MVDKLKLELHFLGFTPAQKQPQSPWRRLCGDERFKINKRGKIKYFMYSGFISSKVN